MLLVSLGFMKKILLLVSTFIAVIFFSACSEKTVEVTTNDSEVILFFSNMCPHCKNVEDFVEANGVKEKVNFVQKEVGMLGEAKSNSNFMLEKQKACSVEKDYLGAVPFLWTKDGKCLMGDVDIINFFKAKIGQTENREKESGSSEQ